ncbi:possible Chitin synthase [Prochlorococcus marinus str. MIT 9313]|uniref:Possible Chitin synthase n=1 Tax=Prochlorococcus marinus (strain MIT 9313) TaxID=74547 RepID=Q7TV68_PROMM|nr:possible Chitin synthase [Prochlorococcus marinus str. MIT 9313]
MNHVVRQLILGLVLLKSRFGIVCDNTYFKHLLYQPWLRFLGYAIRPILSAIGQAPGCFSALMGDVTPSLLVLPLITAMALILPMGCL